MQTYTVHEPPNAGADRIDRASDLKFVKDGFSWVTALFPPLGFALSQLWIPLVAYLLLVGGAVSGLTALGVNEGLIGVLVMGLQILLGFEQSSLQRWSLERAGWTTVGTVTGKSLGECERRFFENWLPSQPMITPMHTPRDGGAPTHAWRSPWKAVGSSFGHKA